MLEFDALPRKDTPLKAAESTDDTATFEKITPEDIRTRMGDPNDDIHKLIKEVVRKVCVNGYSGNTTFKEDLAQEVSLKVWENAASFDGRASLSTWIYKITQNSFRDRMRRNKSRHISETISITELPERQSKNLKSSLSPTEDEIISALDNKRFWNLLSTKIKPAEIDLLKMRFEQELSHAEIASLLKVSEGAIKLRLFHLFKRIRKIMEINEKPKKSGGLA